MNKLTGMHTVYLKKYILLLFKTGAFLFFMFIQNLSVNARTLNPGIYQTKEPLLQEVHYQLLSWMELFVVKKNKM